MTMSARAMITAFLLLKVTGHQINFLNFLLESSSQLFLLFSDNTLLNPYETFSLKRVSKEESFL